MARIKIKNNFSSLEKEMLQKKLDNTENQLKLLQNNTFTVKDFVTLSTSATNLAILYKVNTIADDVNRNIKDALISVERLGDKFSENIVKTASNMLDRYLQKSSEMKAAQAMTSLEKKIDTKLKIIEKSKEILTPETAQQIKANTGETIFQGSTYILSSPYFWYIMGATATIILGVVSFYYINSSINNAVNNIGNQLENSGVGELARAMDNAAGSVAGGLNNTVNFLENVPANLQGTFRAVSNQFQNANGDTVTQQLAQTVTEEQVGGQTIQTLLVTGSEAITKAAVAVFDEETQTDLGVTICCHICSKAVDIINTPGNVNLENTEDLSGFIP